jgi:hypothetical protein
MATQVEKKADKSNWGPGPWQTEPDHVAFKHLGFPCIIHRVTEGHGGLCGYVAMPPGHPWHGKDWNSDSFDPRVHGGVTYGGACAGDICHVAKPGEPDDVWWLGFDCAHSGDLSPAYAARHARSMLAGGGEYRTIEYVMAECRSLAEQAKAAAEVGK